MFGESRCILWPKSDNKRALEMDMRRLVVQPVHSFKNIGGHETHNRSTALLVFDGGA
jgi:hypothetical protein